MKTLTQHKAQGTLPSAFTVIKKRGKYMTFENNEIAYCEKITGAVVFESPSNAQKFADTASLDTRNAGFLRGSQSVEIFTK